MPTIADQWAKSLQKLGVKYVFGIPGGPSIPYLQALRYHGLEFVLVSNEQSAAIMADVCGRLTGIPGACHATFGPGATNLLTGVGGAFLDRSPLIAFTTEVKDSDLGRTVQMNVDHQALFRPLTKWTTRLSRDNFQETMTSAFRIAASEVPGPVHIGLPCDIDGQLLDEDCLAEALIKDPVPLPEPRRLAEAEKLILNARKPILTIGLTAVRLGLHQEIREFIDRNNLPVLLTPMAKGIIGEYHPCYAGVLFHAQSGLLAPIFRQADLVIGIGYDPIEFSYEAWLPDAPLLHIDTSPADVAPGCHLACDLWGDLAHSLRYLNSLRFPRSGWDMAQVSANKNRLFQALTPPSETFTPSKLLTLLRGLLPEDGIITGDVGAHLHLMGQLWRVDQPNRFIITNGWSSMGFGIPAAIGAKLCRPSSQVVCVTGDGGFLMNCGELMTARRLGINVVIIVLCDQALSLIQIKQNWKNAAHDGTDLYAGGYFQADRFLGVHVLKACSEIELHASLEKAFSLPGPVIIEAVVEGSEYGQMITQSYK